jgi:hypothetical protein
MKKNIIVSAALLLASLSLSRAQITIVQWNFENLAITNYSPNPAPSLNNGAGAVSAACFGMNIYATPGVATNDPDVVQGASGDTGANGITNYTHVWRIRGQKVGNGWSSQAPIGTQGASFSVDTTGYTGIQVGFDWYVTTQGEANLQLQYTTDGVNWSNLPVTIPSSSGADGGLLLVNNTGGPDTNSVNGYYLCDNVKSNALAGQDWFTNLTAAITDPAAANNPNFAIRMVNASTGASCFAAAGTPLNNSSGNWRFDNISINGSRLPSAIVEWTFEGLPQVINTNPAPILNNCAGKVSANCIGMQLFGGGTTNAPDVTQGVSGDTGSNGITNFTQIWRIRGVPGNGWTSTAGIGAQGAQFSVDTTGFTNVQVTFDWYLTKQGEANLQLEYTTDGATWSNLPITIPAAQSGSSLQFVDNTADADPNSVQGYYVNSIGYSGGQQWFTNLTATITNPAAANNPNFAVRMVNASTGISCVSGVGTALNNTSGNWRFDNIIISGVASGSVLTAPIVTPSPIATVDGPFTNTFTDNNNWRNAISGISVNGATLTNAAYAISAGRIVFNPSVSPLLQTAGSINISIGATNYSPDLVVQNLASGAAKRLVITAQPAAPTGNGGTLIAQPALALFDQYNNVATNGTATYMATPSAGWSFGPGSGVAQTLINGTVIFTNLSATSASAVSGATITFAASGAAGLSGLPYTTTNSSAFNIPAPATTGFTPGNLAVEQEDVASKNSTFSILELIPTTPNQSSPVNVFPVSATGTNALRQSSSGSTGRLADSDDGTLLAFSAGWCGDSSVADVTTVDPRGAGTFNAQGNYVLQTTYVGLGDATANQARSAVSVDDMTWFMGDKGGVYTNNNNPGDAYIPYSVANPANVRSLKSFGGTVYALQQEGGTDPYSTVLAIVPAPVGAPNPIPGAPANGSQSLFPLEGFPTDGYVLDFYMLRSGNNGNIYDCAYYIDGTNNSSGAIFKYYYTGTIDPATSQQVWVSAGASWPTPNGGDGMCAATNASGGVDLYYTTGSGGTAGNSVIKVHDSAAWNQPINLNSTNTLYALPLNSSATLKGIAFAPLLAPGAPAAATLTASNITAVSATMNASINPNGNATAYWFQYGPTASYGSVTATNTLAAGSSPVIVTGLLTGLSQGTIYHYQIVAANAVATTLGLDRSFTTLAVTPPRLNGTAFNGGTFRLAFTNAPGASFSVLATNNLAAPIASWPVVGQAIESPVGSGNYQFTNSPATNRQFYILRQP